MGRNTYLAILGLLVILWVIQPGFGEIPDQNQTPGYAPGYVLVKAADTSVSGISALASAHAAIHADVIREYATEGIYGLFLVRIPSTLLVTDAITHYQGVPGVAYAEPDYYRHTSAIPSDPEFRREWGLSNTGQEFRENTSPGKAGADIQVTTAWNTITGGNSTVAVIDSGVDYRHPDLAANIWTDPETGTHGYDAITGSLDPMDQLGHGTHCAGIIGAVANNGIGGSGVNWNTSIMPVRFFDRNGQGTVSDEISAITWAVHHGATILSCSFGDTHPANSERDVIASSDALFVVAAGNENQDNDIIPSFPASYNLSNIISVASLSPNGTLSDFSNYGNNSVHLAAPGEEIYSTIRCAYQPQPVWDDPFDSFANWTAKNWTLDDRSFVTPPYSARGMNENDADEMSLTLNQTIDLMNLTHPVISYQAASSTMYSGIRLEVQSPGDASWRKIDSIRYADTAFALKQARIPVEFEGKKISIRFILNKGGNALLDDIMVSDGYGTLREPRWGYKDGTSMATPMVAGAANLLVQYAPGSGWKQVRSAIIASTDPVPGLKDKTITGGRLNVTAALSRLIPPPDPDLLHVSPGWNHLSVPKRLSEGNDTAGKVFGALTNTSGHSVITFQNNTWVPTGVNESISPLTSYWLYTTSAQALPYIPDPNQAGEYTVLLKKGWNGFGVLGNDLLTAKIRLMTVHKNWTSVIGYDPVTQAYEEPIMNGGTGNQSDSRLLFPTQGYWLYMANDTRYSVAWT